jgi:DNA mismatch endonuclease, patch repair protein
MDIFDHQTRSRCMSRIRSKDTKPELIVRKYLYSRGYRYRKNCRRLPGTPDIVMRKYGVVIFIHGCFWHGHSDSHLPQTNTEFWRTKIERNKARDAENREALKAMGWRVMTVWECQLKPAVRQQTLREIEYWINKAYIEHRRPSQVYHLPAEEEEGRKVAEDERDE